MTRFRLVTYNVHKCRGLDWKVSPYRVLNVLQDIRADIIALQEAFEDQASFLADHLKMHVAFGCARQLQSRRYGNAVLSHGSVLSSRCHDLSVSRREPRGCLRVDVQIADDLMIHIFAVHLGTSYLERRRQAGKLVSPDVLEAPDAQGLRIVAGDFNEWSHGLVSRMLSHHMRSADLMTRFGWKRSYPGVAPLLHLDHIYYDGAMHLTGLRLHRTAISLLASDHLPLIGDFEVTH